VTESVAGGGGKEGAKEQRVFYNKRLEGLPALAELGAGGGVPVFVSYSAGEDGALGLDEAAVGRLRKRIEEGGKEGRRARVVVKAFEGRVPHIDQPEQYVDVSREREGGRKGGREGGREGSKNQQRDRLCLVSFPS